MPQGGHPPHQRIFECVLLIGTRSAQSIMASGFTAAQTGRTHDRTRPMLQQVRKFLPRRRRPHMTLASILRPQAEFRDQMHSASKVNAPKSEDQDRRRCIIVLKPVSLDRNATARALRYTQ